MDHPETRYSGLNEWIFNVNLGHIFQAFIEKKLKILILDCTKQLLLAVMDVNPQVRMYSLPDTHTHSLSLMHPLA